MRRAARLALLLGGCLLGGCLLGPCQQNGPPPPDSCDRPTDGTVSRLELGPGSFEDDRPFTLYNEGDTVTPVRGGQGATMIGLRLRLSGAAPPECVAQRTTFTDVDGARLATADVPLRTYQDVAAQRTTKTLWIPAEFPPARQLLFVEVTAAKQSLVRALIMAGEAPERDLAAPPEPDLSLRPADLARHD